MDRAIKLELRMPDNKFKTFEQTFVPFHKRHDYIRLEKELEERKDKNGNRIEPTEAEYEEMQADFVAGLFEDETVTKDLIMNGLDVLDRQKPWEIIRYRVLGFNKEEDEATKKAVMEELLAGEDSMTSNLNSSEK